MSSIVVNFGSKVLTRSSEVRISFSFQKSFWWVSSHKGRFLWIVQCATAKPELDLKVNLRDYLR